MYITLFKGKSLTWKDGMLGPIFYPTDFGSCCILVPHLYFHMHSGNKSVAELYHELDATALNGEENGLHIVLNLEQFNYAFYQSQAAGFKISLHHHSGIGNSFNN